MNIQLELTNRCNLRCVECPNHKMQRERGFISNEVFLKVLNDYIIPLRGEQPTVILHKDGEPLLHNNIRFFIREIEKYRTDIKLDIYTNGVLLNDDFVAFLSTVKNPVWILVSFHFIDYLGRMINSTDSLHWRLKQMMDDAGKNITFVVVTHEHDYIQKDFLDRWLTEWLEHKSKTTAKIDGVFVNPSINPWGGLIEDSHNSSFTSCPYADGEHLFIGYTGNVIPCCIDLEEDAIIGNVFVDDVSTIMSRRSEFYSDVVKHGGSLCHRCLKV